MQPRSSSKTVSEGCEPGQSVCPRRWFDYLNANLETDLESYIDTGIVTDIDVALCQQIS